MAAPPDHNITTFYCAQETLSWYYVASRMSPRPRVVNIHRRLCQRRSQNFIPTWQSISSEYSVRSELKTFAFKKKLSLFWPLYVLHAHTGFPAEIIMAMQWRIQDFPEEGHQLSRGAPTYDFAKFPQKLHEIERIWTPGGGSTRPKFYYVGPPLLCVDLFNFKINW